MVTASSTPCASRSSSAPRPSRSSPTAATRRTGVPAAASHDAVLAAAPPPIDLIDALVSLACDRGPSGTTMTSTRTSPTTTTRRAAGATSAPGGDGDATGQVGVAPDDLDAAAEALATRLVVEVTEEEGRRPEERRVGNRLVNKCNSRWPS